MKRLALAGLALVVALGLAGAASAHMWGSDGDSPGYYGMGPGMMYGYGGGYGPGSTTDVEKFKQFQKETATLRDEMAVKRIELNAELTKDTPDKARVTALRKDIRDLRTRIDQSAEKAGIDSDRGRARGRGFRGNGPGRMYGSGYGCGW